MPVFNVSSEPLTQIMSLQADWLELQARSDARYFQSWGWISCWLEKVALEQSVTLIRVRRDDVLVGLGLFVSASLLRRAFIRADVMFLNEYPLADNDMVIEYNGLLAQAGCEADVSQHCLQYLSQHYPSVDEFHFGAQSQLAYDGIALSDVINLRHRIEKQSQSWQVDLTKLTSGLDAYLETLSKNSREQIRYSLRQYEQNSSVTFNVAEDVEQALSYFDALKIYHVKRWREKGESHAFAGKWESFHRYIIRQRFSEGEIQIIKLANEEQEIAYLFNYVWNKRVYVLQMGFNYSDNHRLKPGYLAHAMAVALNRDNGMLIYDFMHGYSRYKSSLSNMSETLTWSVFQRPRLRFKFERIITRLVRMLRKSSEPYDGS